jgi:hypothetical protein
MLSTSRNEKSASDKNYGVMVDVDPEAFADHVSAGDEK